MVPIRSIFTKLTYDFAIHQQMNLLSVVLAIFYQIGFERIPHRCCMEDDVTCCYNNDRYSSSNLLGKATLINAVEDNNTVSNSTKIDGIKRLLLIFIPYTTQ